MRRATYILALCVVGIAMVVLFTASHRSPQPKPWPRYLGNVQRSADRSIAEAVGRFDGWVRAEEANQAAAMEAANEAAIAASVQAQAAPPPTAISAPTTTAPSSSPVTGSGSSGDDAAIWDCVIQHESGGDPTAVNPSSGAGGLVQFLVSTWQSISGLSGGAQDYPAATQMQYAYQLQSEEGWWP